jgi:hypothetical protein
MPRRSHVTAASIGAIDRGDSSRPSSAAASLSPSVRTTPPTARRPSLFVPEDDHLRNESCLVLAFLGVPKRAICLDELVVVPRTVPSDRGARRDGLAEPECHRANLLVEDVDELHLPGNPGNGLGRVVLHADVEKLSSLYRCASKSLGSSSLPSNVTVMTLLAFSTAAAFSPETVTFCHFAAGMFLATLDPWALNRVTVKRRSTASPGNTRSMRISSIARRRPRSSRLQP